MSYIINIWELHDFCYSHGRVIPHYYDNEGHFTKFHCADRRHDDSETIICSDGQGVQIGTMVGILTMKGYVVEFNDKDQYLFCTKDELELLKEESEREKALIEQQRKEAEANAPEHPARPRGVKISAEVQDRRFQSYYACPDFKSKIDYARARGLLTPPYALGDYSFRELLCKEDCIFPNCPFYELRLLSELRHNHREDYDTWVIEFTKNAPGIHD